MLKANTAPNSKMHQLDTDTISTVHARGRAWYGIMSIRGPSSVGWV